jgi:hypothetical protein
VAMSGELTQVHGGQRMQDFIFARELAEVYLLLDHLSGRSDKSLTSLIGDGEEKTGNGWIQKICEIGWEPKGTVAEQASQAVTLLLAKDRLNSVAKPANGASIAFTLLVTGDDDGPAVQPKYPFGLWNRLKGRERTVERPQMSARVTGAMVQPPSVPAGGSEAANSAQPPVESASNAANAAPTIPQLSVGADNGTGDSASPPSGVWGDQSPSRLSLARQAYPGLVNRARQFNRRIKFIIFLLLFWLIFTCLLSWNIAAGHAILARIDAIETTKTSILKRIAAAEVMPESPGARPTLDASVSFNAEVAPESAGARPTPDASASSNAEVTSVTQGAKPTVGLPASTKPVLIVRYCDRPHLLPLRNPSTGVSLHQFENATQRQICDELNDNLIANYNSHEDLADWLAPWRWLHLPSHLICGGDKCTKDPTVPLLDASRLGDQHQWAAVMVEVLTTAVLPLCYGFLGAGAAVVRSIWGKMRDSLLSPRDLTLSLGQLALGAVIGACIGLFITPSGLASQGASGLTSSVTLTPSALSFIAGFGVEGVFLALESFIKRVFNIPDSKP